MSEKRFEITYTQGVVNCFKVIVDNVTGVNYIFHSDGSAGGLTPLLDREGKPVITPILNK